MNETSRSAPIIAAVDGSTTGLAAARDGARLACELDLPLVLVHVRRRPQGWLGRPYFQRRLDRQIVAAQRALDEALTVARRESVEAECVVLEGPPARRIRELAEARDAAMVVVGARPRRLKKSTSRRVMRDSPRTVAVARG